MAVLFYLMLILITTEVVLRFIFDSGLAWSEEVSRYLFVWLIYFSISYATRNNKHIRVFLILGKLPEIIQRISMLISDILFLLFSAFLLTAAISVCQYNLKAGNMAITVPVTINILYAAGVMGFFLMTIRMLKNIWWKLCHWKAPLEEFENFDGAFYNEPEVCFIPKPAKPQASDNNKEV